MDDLNRKAIERMDDILDAIKIEVDTIIEGSNTYEEDVKVSDTIYNLTQAFDLIYRNVR